MPGFIVAGIGGDSVVAGVAANDEPRRKHRWVFETIGGNPALQQNILVLLKEASRPSHKFDEAEMAHNQESAWFAGRTKWEPCKLTWYDIEQPIDSSAAIWKWLLGVADYTSANLVVHLPSQYKQDSKLDMLKGDGSISETWTMYNSWPLEVNWNNLSYTESEICLIEVSLRYDRATKTQ